MRWEFCFSGSFCGALWGHGKQRASGQGGPPQEYSVEKEERWRMNEEEIQD